MRRDSSHDGSGIPESSPTAADGSRACAWCREPLSVFLRAHARFCSQRCRQSAHRFGAECVVRRRATDPLELGYADPPYPGTAARYYSDHPDYLGEVDHKGLLTRLDRFDAWALSTSSTALPSVLALCHARKLPVRVAAWVRGDRRVRSTRPRSAWEPVIYRPGRVLAEPSLDVGCDVLQHVPRPRTTDPDRVIGAKPAAFWYWLFDLLGAAPGDTFTDLFRGSGGGARAWNVFASAPPADGSVASGRSSDGSVVSSSSTRDPSRRAGAGKPSRTTSDARRGSRGRGAEPRSRRAAARRGSGKR